MINTLMCTPLTTLGQETRCSITYSTNLEQQGRSTRIFSVPSSLCVTDTAGVQSTPQPKPAFTDFDLHLYAAAV